MLYSLTSSERVTYCNILASFPYSIITASSHFPTDGAGKTFTRTARRSLQLVNLASGSKVINVLRISCL